MICLLAFDLSQAYVVPPVPFSYSISSNIMQDSSRLDMSPMPYVPYYPDKARKDYMWLDTTGEVDQNTTICVRVFKHGGYYEILLNSKYYLVLGNEDWLEDSPDLIEKELYEWCNGEIFNMEEN